MAPIPSAATAAAKELVQTHSQVLHQVLADAGIMTIKCAVELDIFDIIHHHGEPLPLSDLVALLAIPGDKASYVRRLMRLLAHMGYFEVHKVKDDDDEDAYSLTAYSKIFLKDSPTTLASWLLGVQSPHLQAPWQMMSAWFRQDRHRSPFELRYGKSMFGFADENPEFNRLLNDTMVGDTGVFMAGIIAGCPGVFDGVGSLVDVAGGKGATTKAIKEAFPGIKCTVFDLPHVVATIPKSPLFEAVGGDMFDSIPKSDVVFTKQILHNWNHEDSVKLLKKCKEAIPSREEGGKVIIVDIVVNAPGDDSSTTETKLWWDITMLSYTEGAEREESEWKKVFEDAGYSGYKINPLGLRSLIEVFP